MVINMVIVDDNVERGEKAGRLMAKGLRVNFINWEMFVHVRKSTNKLTDDAYARYTA